MNKYLIALLISLSINCFSRDNKYTKLFQAADSAFADSANLKVFESINLTINNEGTQAKITIKEADYLQMYWIGFIDGSLSALEKKSFDFETLKKNIKANKKTMKSHQLFIKHNNHE